MDRHDTLEHRYDLLTDKVLSSMRVAAGDCGDVIEEMRPVCSTQLSGKRFSYVMKTDDDSYVDLPLLLSWLNGTPRERMYGGRIISGAGVIDSKTQRWGNRQFFEDTGLRTYPAYASGSGYVLSHDLAVYLAQRAVPWKTWRIEDGSLGSYLLGLDISYQDNKLIAIDIKDVDEACQIPWMVMHKLTVPHLHYAHSHCRHKAPWQD